MASADKLIEQVRLHDHHDPHHGEFRLAEVILGGTIAIPIAVPTIPHSESGVSITRSTSTSTRSPTATGDDWPGPTFACQRMPVLLSMFQCDGGSAAG